VRALRILVPASELRSFVEQDQGDLVWLPTPSKGSVAVVSIFLTSPDAELSLPPETRDARIFGKVQTPVRTAWAIYAYNPIDQTIAKVIAAERAKLKVIPAPAAGWPSGTRASLWEDRTDHIRDTLELAYSDDAL